MSALAQPRQAKPYTFKNGSMVLAASVKATKGGVCVIDSAATGSVKPMVAGVTTLTRIGLFTEDNDNSANESTSRVMVTLDREIVGQWLDNATGGAAVVASDLYGSCYMLDDHTVQHTSSGNSKAGTPFDLDAIDGVAVVVLP